MLSSVVGAASEIANDSAILADVGETAMRLAGDLAASGAPPGRLESRTASSHGTDFRRSASTGSTTNFSR